MVSYADTNGIFIQARDVVPGTFGEDEGAGDFTFPSNLNVLNEINTKILNATNLSVSNSFEYGGIELDDRYVNTGSNDLIGESECNKNNLGKIKIENSQIYLCSQGEPKKSERRVFNEREERVCADWKRTWYGKKVCNRYETKTVTDTDIEIYYTEEFEWKVLKEKIDEDFVNENQIDSISSEMIVDRGIGLDDLADNSVNSNKIVSGAITFSELGANSIDSTKIMDYSIGEEDLSDRLISENKIASGAIKTNHIYDAQITSSKITDGTIKLEDISIDNFDEIFALQSQITQLENEIREIKERSITLNYQKHTRGDCRDLGGTVHERGFCKFNRNSCPVGWTQYRHWSETEKATGRTNHCRESKCTTEEHPFSDTPRETCQYRSTYKHLNVCKSGSKHTKYATITKIGCY